MALVTRGFGGAKRPGEWGSSSQLQIMRGDVILTNMGGGWRQIDNETVVQLSLMYNEKALFDMIFEYYSDDIMKHAQVVGEWKLDNKKEPIHPYLLNIVQETWLDALFVDDNFVNDYLTYGMAIVAFTNWNAIKNDPGLIYAQLETYKKLSELIGEITGVPATTADSDDDEWDIPDLPPDAPESGRLAKGRKRTRASSAHFPYAESLLGIELIKVEDMIVEYRQLDRAKRKYDFRVREKGYQGRVREDCFVFCEQNKLTPEGRIKSKVYKAMATMLDWEEYNEIHKLNTRQGARRDLVRTEERPSPVIDMAVAKAAAAGNNRLGDALRNATESKILDDIETEAFLERANQQATQAAASRDLDRMMVVERNPLLAQLRPEACGGLPSMVAQPIMGLPPGAKITVLQQSELPKDFQDQKDSHMEFLLAQFNLTPTELFNRISSQAATTQIEISSKRSASLSDKIMRFLCKVLNDMFGIAFKFERQAMADKLISLDPRIGENDDLRWMAFDAIQHKISMKALRVSPEADLDDLQRVRQGGHLTKAQHSHAALQAAGISASVPKEAGEPNAPLLPEEKKKRKQPKRRKTK